MRNHGIRCLSAILLGMAFAFSLVSLPAAAEELPLEGKWREFVENTLLTDRTALYIPHLLHVPDERLRQNWMGLLSGERFLNEINIPGTHDSGMADPEVLAPLSAEFSEYARTQYHQINEQLNNGIRMLDIRLLHKREHKIKGKYRSVVEDGDLWVTHGKGFDAGLFYIDTTYWGQDEEDRDLTFTKVLGWIKDFLDHHPTETIILYIRPETNDGGERKTIMQRASNIVREELYNATNGNGEPYLFIPEEEARWYPQLQDCRGQVLIRCSADYTQLAWANPIEPDEDASPFHTDCAHEDEYDVSADTKISNVKKLYRDNPNRRLPVYIYGHFGTPVLYDVWLNSVAGGRTPIGIAIDVNNDLLESGKLFDERMRYFGWVTVDAERTVWCDYIWKSNFLDDGDCCTVSVQTGLPEYSMPLSYCLPKGTTITIPPCIYNVRDGADITLVSWACGDEVYYPGQSFTVNGDVTFTAQWTTGTSKRIEILWDDDEDADGIRPTHFYLSYRRFDGSAYQDYEQQLGFVKEDPAAHYAHYIWVWSGSYPSDAQDVRLMWKDDVDWIEVNVEEQQGGTDQDRHYSYRVSYTEEDGWKFLFKHTPVTASVRASGDVVWQDVEDKDGLRPESVKVRLLRDGEPAGEPLAVSAETGWRYDFGDFLLYHNGIRYAYGVEEMTMAGETEIDGYTVVPEGFRFTNIHNPLDAVTLSGTLAWDDDGDRDRLRPEGTTLTLYDGETPAKTQVVSADTGWRYDFGTLDVYRDGLEIPYRIKCDAPNYWAEMSLAGPDGPSVTLIHAPAAVHVVGRIRWEDETPEARPGTVEVRLLADGEEADRQDVGADEDGNWMLDFGERFAYRDGEMILYTLTADVDGYMTSYDAETCELLIAQSPVVVLDFGKGHEALAAACAETLNASVSGARVSVRTAAGQTMARPSEPALDGYDFDGWYRVTGPEETAENPFDFENTPIAEPVTLKAAWTVTASFADAAGEPRGSVTARPVFQDTGTLRDGWYAVPESVTVPGRMTVSGSVNLILCDGKTLKVSKGGISVNEGSSLTIWAQSQGTGTLTATGKGSEAGIGGDDGMNGGTVVVYGGQVTAWGGVHAAGIGGGYKRGGGTVVIDSGTVTAKGGSSAAGIGGGYRGNGGTITISGGTVDSASGGSAAGIGGGYRGDGGTITLSGGDVTARSVNAGTGIGGGGTLLLGGGDTAADIVLTYDDGSIRVLADSYNGTVTLERNFAAEEGFAFEQGEYAGWKLYALAEMTLRDAVTAVFDSDGGSGVGPQILVRRPEGVLLTRPEDPTKAGCLLDYWYPETGDDTAGFDFENALVTEDVVLRAKWRSHPFGDTAFALPAALTAIRASAFAGDTRIIAVDARACASVGAGAFRGCAGLERIRLPQHCAIDDTAFEGCGTVYVYAPAGGSTQTWCRGRTGVVFVEDPQN